jgi:hypothetical protein
MTPRKSEITRDDLKRRNAAATAETTIVLVTVISSLYPPYKGRDPLAFTPVARNARSLCSWLASYDRVHSSAMSYSERAART